MEKVTNQLTGNGLHLSKANIVSFPSFTFRKQFTNARNDVKTGIESMFYLLSDQLEKRFILVGTAIGSTNLIGLAKNVATLRMTKYNPFTATVFYHLRATNIKKLHFTAVNNCETSLL